MITKNEFPEQVGVRLSREDRRELERVAREEKRPMGQLCRIVLHEYLASRPGQKQRQAAS